MNYHKKIMIILILSSLIFSPLFASLVTLTWQWSADDENVTSFRYKLNDNEWVSVDTSVTEFTLQGVDEDSFYTLEVQQSYDGISYDEGIIKSYGTAPITQESIEIPIVDEEIEIAQEEFEALDQEVPVETEQEVVESALVIEPTITEEEIEIPQEEPKKVTKLTPPNEDDGRIEALDSNPWIAIEFSIGTGGKGDNKFLQSVFDPDGKYKNVNTKILPSFTFDFVYGNIITLSEKDYFNLRAGVGFNLYKLSSANSTFIGSDGHIGLDYNHRYGEKFTLTSGLGLSIMFPNIDLSIGSDANLFYGPYITLGGRYKINEFFSITANAETKLLFSNVFTPYELTGIVRVGFTYRF